MKLVWCATLLAFALITPAAHAGPPKPQAARHDAADRPDERARGRADRGFGDDALERLDRQLGHDPALPGQRRLPPRHQHEEDDHLPGAQLHLHGPRAGGRPDGELLRAERPAAGHDGAGRDRAHEPREPAADGDDRRRASRWRGIARPTAGRSATTSSTSTAGSSPAPARSRRACAIWRRARRTTSRCAPATTPGTLGVQQHAHRDDAGERRRRRPDAAVEPHRRGPRRLLRQRDPALGPVDRRRRPPVGDRVRDLPQRRVLHAGDGHRVRRRLRAETARARGR